MSLRLVCEVWLSLQWVTLTKQLRGWLMLDGFTANDPLCIYQRRRLNPPCRPHRWSWRGPDWLMISMRRSPSGRDPWSWWRRTSCLLTLLSRRSSMVDTHWHYYILIRRPEPLHFPILAHFGATFTTNSSTRTVPAKKFLSSIHVISPVLYTNLYLYLSCIDWPIPPVFVLMVFWPRVWL